MYFRCFDKPIKPRWLGIDIRGDAFWACPICNKIIRDKTDVCPCCGQKFTYEEGEVE